MEHGNETQHCACIDSIRRGLGLLIAELAALAEVPTSTVWHVLEGKTVSPRFATIEKLVIGLSAGDLPITEMRQRSRLDDEKFTSHTGDFIVLNTRRRAR